MKTVPVDFRELATFQSLLAAFREAARGKRSRPQLLEFAYDLEGNLLALERELLEGTYRPGPYRKFTVEEPKRRIVSAAPFRDRVVHHLVASVLAPEFERRMIHDSYANRVGKGTHRATRRCQEFARRFGHYVKIDVVKFFPSIDHEVLLGQLGRVFRPGPFLELLAVIVRSGQGVGFQLPDVGRPRGLPLGNLTSQWFANFFLTPGDHFIQRELRIGGYLRFMDDILLLDHDSQRLLSSRAGIESFLAERRLQIHEHAAGVHAVESGIPFLGFRIYPTHRVLLPSRARRSARKLELLRQRLEQGTVTAVRFARAVESWVAHARGADSYRLRRRILGEARKIEKKT